MMPQTELNTDCAMVTVQVPLTIRRRGGRRLISLPGSATQTAMPISPQIDNASVKAIARGYRWMRVLESGEFATIEELADSEKINPSYVSRVLRLTLLAPEIIERVLDGRHPPTMQLDELLKPFPEEWEQQRVAFKL